MDFKNMFPDFANVEQHVRRAHVERSVYLAHVIAEFLTSATRGFRKVADSMGSGLAAERDQRAVEADAFLKRSVPKY
jgi:hypothetical protein